MADEDAPAPPKLLGPEDVLLPSSILSKPTPSARDGVSASLERAHRAWGCVVASEAGVLLGLPQVVQATSQNLLQRFYWRKSLNDPRFDAFTVSMACVFLASKIEETPRKLRHVLYAFHAIYRRRKFGHGGGGDELKSSEGIDQEKNEKLPGDVEGTETKEGKDPLRCDARAIPLELGGPRYSKWRSRVMETERHVLKELGFGFYQMMEHPHKFLLYYIEYLSQNGMVADGPRRALLAQHAWAYLNDSSRLDLCVRFATSHVACAAILMASRRPEVAISLPAPEWILALGADPQQVSDACERMLEAYDLDTELLRRTDEPSSSSSGSGDGGSGSGGGDDDSDAHRSGRPSGAAVWLEPLHDDCAMNKRRQKDFDDHEERVLVKESNNGAATVAAAAAAAVATAITPLSSSSPPPRPSQQGQEPGDGGDDDSSKRTPNNKEQHRSGDGYDRHGDKRSRRSRSWDNRKHHPHRPRERKHHRRDHRQDRHRHHRSRSRSYDDDDEEEEEANGIGGNGGDARNRKKGKKGARGDEEEEENASEDRHHHGGGNRRERDRERNKGRGRHYEGDRGRHSHYDGRESTSRRRSRSRSRDRDRDRDRDRRDRDRDRDRDKERGKRRRSRS